MPDENYHYHIFALYQENSDSVDTYVAEGDSPVDGTPIFSDPEHGYAMRDDYIGLSGLVHGIYLSHKDQPGPFEYLSFSFDPKCKVAILDGDLLYPRKISEEEQAQFVLAMRDRIRDHYDGYVFE